MLKWTALADRDQEQLQVSNSTHVISQWHSTHVVVHTCTKWFLPVLAPVFEKNLVAGCKDSIGWMFSKLDTSNDLYLDHSELSAINLEKYEVCIRPFFNSCDSYHDGRVSMAEWCLCFWRESELIQDLSLIYRIKDLQFIHFIMTLCKDCFGNWDILTTYHLWWLSCPLEPPCLAEIERLQVKEVAKRKPGIA